MMFMESEQMRTIFRFRMKQVFQTAISGIKRFCFGCIEEAQRDPVEETRQLRRFLLFSPLNKAMFAIP